MSTKDKFTEIYETGHWKSGESLSGSGSDLEQVKALTNSLLFFFNAEKIRTVVDCPCGDMNWQMPLVGAVSHYVGCDIVPELISENIVRLIVNADPKPKNLGFRVVDIIEDDLSPGDFLMVRDCLVHLPQASVITALLNIVDNDAHEWIGMTTFPGRTNVDIELGQWRPIDLCAAPYSLPFPTYLFVERCTEQEGSYSDKCLGIWTLRQLKQWSGLSF